MKETDQNKKPNPSVRLPLFLQIVRIAAFLIVFLFLFAVWRFPEHFSAIRDVKLFLQILAVFALVNTVFAYFVPKLVKSKVFYSAYLYNILWAFFMTAIVYSMGGVQSYFVIILIFPILTTAFDLEARAAATLGILTEILFLAMMIFDQRYSHTTSYYVAGVMNMFYIGLFSYYLYSIIKEGIRQRFEKEEIKRKYFDLAEVDKAKTEFMTVTSHQLQTPLSELRWALNTVLEGKRVDQETEGILKNSVNSVNKLVDLVRNLIQVSRLEKPGLAYRQAPVDVANEIEVVIQNLKSEIERKKVRVVFNRPAENFAVNGDPDRLQMAFANVIDNAVRYSPGGTVTITLAQSDRGVTLEIKDTGIGIPPQEQPQVFTKFFRASNAIKLEPNETGIGLYTVKNIVEKHFGTIDFTSEPEKGTTFTIFLPFSSAPHSKK